jgi:hypothetical protein
MCSGYWLELAILQYLSTLYQFAPFLQHTLIVINLESKPINVAKPIPPAVNEEMLLLRL